MDKSLLDYVGDISQICGMKRYVFIDGSAKGVEAVDVDNGSLSFTVLLDRCMDIHRLKFHGMPVAFISRTGVVAPALYNERDMEWLRGFGAGFLTTCGFTQAGDPCISDGEPHGLHGRASYLPATLTQFSERWENDDFVMTLRGKVRQAKHQGENITLDRTITCTLNKNEVLLRDVIANEGSRPEPLMLLYHMNFGYPLLSPGCEIVIPSQKVVGWDDFSQREINSWSVMEPPTSNAQNYTYLHTVRKDAAGKAGFMICNNTELIAVCVTYYSDVLHTLGQWKYPCKRDYIMALEPCNNCIKGVQYERENGTLQFIEPDNTVTVEIKAEFLDNTAEINRRKNCWM